MSNESREFAFQFEADRRAFMITINSFDTGLTQDERAKLYPTCGHLHPDGLQELRRTDNYDGVRDVASRYPVRVFLHLFSISIDGFLGV